LRPERFTLKTMAARLEKRGDSWKGFWQKRQRLEKAIERLSEEVQRQR
jgi:DNA primase